MSDNSVALSFDPRGIATVTLQREHKHNAFDDRMIAELSRVFAEIASSDARVMVLAAAGKSFSAGADLGWMKRMADYSEQENAADAAALAAMLQSLNEMPQPSIARVQGPAYGGAVGLISCCDMAVGSTEASFCLSEVKIGLIPATISPYVLAAIGPRAARRYFTTAEVFNAETALQLGLLSEVIAADELDSACEHLLTTLLDNGPCAIRAAKRLALDYAHQGIDAQLIDNSCQRIAAVRVSQEGQAGLGAFLDKRPAPWRKPHV